MRTIDRFLAKVRHNPDTGCLEWTASLTRKGYARFRYWGKMGHASRFILEYTLGRPLRPGMEACHTCHVRHCVHPNHLYEGTHRENIDDAIARGSYKKTLATHCVRGHELAGANVRHDGQGRHCRQCDQITQRARRGVTRPHMTVWKVLAIRAWLRTGETGRAVAKRMNVSTAAVSNINTGRTWSHIDDNGRAVPNEGQS